MVSFMLVFGLLALFLSHSKAYGDQVFKIASGRQMSLPSLRAHFPRSSDQDIYHKLFEIMPDFTVVGPNGTFNLLNVTGPARKVVPHPNLRFLRDGKDAPMQKRLDVFVRIGNVVSFGHLADGTVLGVWGESLSLNPLHADKHPGVFHNIFRPDAIPRHIRKDGGSSKTFIKGVVVGSPDEFDEVVLSNDLHPAITDDDMHVASRQSKSCRDRTVRKAVEIAMAFSHRQCNANGGYAKTVAAIESAVELASDPYEKQTCLKLTISAFDGFCKSSSDPYATYQSKYSGSSRKLDRMLPDFAKFWKNNRKTVKRDVAHFLPAFRDGVDTAGVAYLGGACSRDYGYGWSEGMYSLVIAHEVGHNLNADHSNSGLMTASGSVDSKKFSFSSQSVNEISNFVDGRSGFGNDASCLTEYSSSPDKSPTPDANPSESPRPSQSRNPINTPKPSPSNSPPGPNPTKAPADTCAGRFTKKLAFKCDKKPRTYKRVNLYTEDDFFGEWKIGSLKPSYSQESNSVLFSVKATRVKITAVAAFGSFDDSLTTTDVGPGEKIKKSKSAKVRVPMASISTSSKSCCKKTVHIYTPITVQWRNFFNKGTGTIVLKAAVKLKCFKCNKNRFIPSSTSQKCAICKKK